MIFEKDPWPNPKIFLAIAWCSNGNYVVNARYYIKVSYAHNSATESSASQNYSDNQ